MKRLKNWALALIMIPCVLFLTACGDGAEKQFEETASVNTQGTYTTTTKTELNEYLGSSETVIESEKTTINGFRITGSTTEDGMEIEYNGIVLLGETLAETEMAFKIGMVYNGQNTSSYMYLKDGTMYMHTKAPGMEAKIKMPLSEEGDLDEILNDNVEGMAFTEDILQEILDNDDVTVKVFVSGDTKKYEIKENVIEGALNSGLTTYLVYENDVLQGISYEMELSSGTTTITIQNYDGEIKYPSFDDYADYSTML